MKEDFRGDYWQSDADLRAYDQTYAERIGWKWDAVLRELALRGWMPPNGRVVDWGCGTGIASRRYSEAWSKSGIEKISLYDMSPRARQFAAQRQEAEFPGVAVEVLDSPAAVGNLAPGFVLLVSHVLNELKPAQLETLLQVMIQKASCVIWVEPGTKKAGQALPRLRETLRKNFRVLAPCTYQGRCGMLDRSQDWCHHFAKVPSFVFQDSNWVRFAKEAGIDLRSLPYSFLVLASAESAQNVSGVDESYSRIIGDPRHYKGYSKILACDKLRMVQELTLQKRDAPELLNLIKDQRKSEKPALYRLECAGEKIMTGASV